MKRPSRRQAQQPQLRPPRKQQQQRIRPRPLRSHLTRRRRRNSRLNRFAKSICTYEEIYLSTRWVSIAVGLRTKGDDRDESTWGEKREQHHSGQSITCHFEQDRVEHDHQRVEAEQRDEDRVHHDYFVAESVG